MMNNDNITLTFSDYINADSVKAFVEKLVVASEKAPDSNLLTVFISSAGGDIDVAIELYNFIRSLDCRVKMVNTSYVNSAAVIVFLAGDERVCLHNSSFYVHSVSKKLNGDYNTTELLREVKEMKTNTDKIAELLAETTKKNKVYWKQMMSKGFIITAKKSVELGLSDKTERPNKENRK